MSDIQVLIKMLQSNDANKRYDACEELRVSRFLNTEALEALQVTATDENPEVADAARRAIELHKSTSTIGEEEKEKTTIDKVTGVEFITGGVTGGLLVFLIYIFVVIIPDTQANGGLRQWFIYRSHIAGFQDVLPGISISFILGFLGGALGTIGLPLIKHRDLKQQVESTEEMPKDQSNQPVKLEIQSGIKRGGLSIVIIVVAILLLCILPCLILSYLGGDNIS